MKTWDDLSMAEKSEMIGVAVRNGITDLATIRQKYNEFADGGNISNDEYLATMEKVAEENYKKWGFDNPDVALMHALNDNTYDYRGYYSKYPQSRANADTHWSDEFKTVYHPTFSNESRYHGVKSQYNPLGLPGGWWSGEDFMPMAWQLLEHEYKKGGSIHIDPSKKGTFTAAATKHGMGVQEFASKVLAYPENYSPAMRKKANFARNARKWKHDYGGPLVEAAAHYYDGESEKNQQMNKSRFVQRLENTPSFMDDLEYFNKLQRYQARKEVEYLAERDRNKRAKKINDYLTESNDVTATPFTRNSHLEDRTIAGAKSNALWEQEHPSLTQWEYLTSAAPFAIATAPALSWAAETSLGSKIGTGLRAITNSIYTPKLNAAATALVGTNGIKDIIDGNLTPETVLDLGASYPVLPAVKSLAADRWRRSVYRNAIPYSYSLKMKAAEFIPTTYDFLSFKPLDVSEKTILPWQERWASAKRVPLSDKTMGVRRQAYAKYLGMPDKFEYPIYRYVGKDPNGMKVYEANLENILEANGEKVTKASIKNMVDNVRKSTSENYDYLLGNHQHITARKVGNDVYFFNDPWDINPLARYKGLPTFIRDYEFGPLMGGGQPFIWRQTINPIEDIWYNKALWNKVN